MIAWCVWQRKEGKHIHCKLGRTLALGDDASALPYGVWVLLVFTGRLIAFTLTVTAHMGVGLAVFNFVAWYCYAAADWHTTQPAE